MKKRRGSGVGVLEGRDEKKKKEKEKKKMI
jgi:hypothetical protein